MNKILMTLAVGAAALGWSSCSETWDDNPVLKVHEGIPTVDILNVPAMQNQSIMLTSDNSTGTFHLTCSQPDYGYAAIATYRVQCSLTEDFAVYEEIVQDFYNCAQINPLNDDVAAALEALSGVETKADLPVPYKKLYMRLRVFIAQSEENTQYYSNPVYFEGVGADYLAVWQAGQPADMYIRGELNGWGAEAAYQFKTGKEKFTWVIDNITMPAGGFKIAGSSWDDLDLGAAEENVSITPGKALDLSWGGKNIGLDNDFTGKVLVVLKSGNYTVTLDPAK